MGIEIRLLQFLLLLFSFCGEEIIIWLKLHEYLNQIIGPN